MFLEALDTLLRDHASPAAVRRIEAGGDPDGLWQGVAGAGFLELMSPEPAGGAALALHELYPIVELIGRHAVPLPLADAIAARALVAAGTPLPDTPLALASHLSRDAQGALVLARVPLGDRAQHLLAADGEHLLLIDAQAADRQSEADPAGGWARWRVMPGPGVRSVPGDGRHLLPMAAALHAALIAGAARRCLEMTLAHCNQREQFGKPLGKFQAVQQQLSEMAEHVAAAAIAAESAFRPGPGGGPQLLPCAMAKARASEAAVLVAATAHALHGAIGVTQEFDLQLYTRRLRAWRVAHGSEDHWHRVIGHAVLTDDRTVLDLVRA